MSKVSLPPPAETVAAEEMMERYKRALYLIRGDRCSRVVKNSTAHPVWIKGREQFFYTREVGDGYEYRLVDINKGTNEVAFDHGALASELALATGRKVGGHVLPIWYVDMDPGEGIMSFDAFGRRWAYNCHNKTLSHIGESKAKGITEPVSPDGRWAVFSKDHNIWIRDLISGEERALTNDGKIKFDYGRNSGGTPTEGLHGNFDLLWSPDSKKILTVKADFRHVTELKTVDFTPADGSMDPAVSKRTPFIVPPEEPTATIRLVAIDVESGEQRYADYAPVTHFPFGWGTWGYLQALGWWSHDSRSAWFIDIDRYGKRVRVVSFDTRTGVAKRLFEETSDSLIPLGLLAAENAPLFLPLPETNELLWHSERSGWGHLYLYDLKSGQLKHQVTSGNWLVRNVVRYLPETREIFLQTAGRSEGRDPFYRDLVCVNIDTGELTELVSGNYDHLGFAPGDSVGSHVASMRTLDSKALRDIVEPGTIGSTDESGLVLSSDQRNVNDYNKPGLKEYSCNGVSPSGRFAVVTRSRVDTITESFVVNRDGERVMDLEVSDLSGLPEGWQWPEPVKLKAADDETDIYGVVYRPTHFSPDKNYPIICEIVDTYQVLGTVPPKSAFNTCYFPYFRQLALAELGFIVVQLAGRNTPFYSKAFRDGAYGRPDLVNDIADHVVGIKQLAKRYPYMDIDRVGVTGGLYYFEQTTIRAMLRFPEFFKIGVSGPPSDRRYNGGHWLLPQEGPAGPSEGYQNVEELAANLDGKLLLTLNTSYKPGVVFRLIDAFRRANKDVDITASAMPSSTLSSYDVRRMWDYFVMHLKGSMPPDDFEINGVYSTDKPILLWERQGNVDFDDTPEQLPDADAELNINSNRKN